MQSYICFDTKRESERDRERERERESEERGERERGDGAREKYDGRGNKMKN